VPYYGAAGIIDHVQEHLFDGTFVLVGEDGSVTTADGKPVLQFVRGRIWVNNHAHVLRCASAVDTRYLYYFLQTVPIRPYLSGSVQPKLTQGNLNRIPVRWPTATERASIASVLGALDDKIDLNRRMCQTLEEMARALFKSWFVDFDPVRAKMEGRDPGLPKEIADLFPSRLVDSELGPIPEGWRVAATAEIADVIYGAPFASSRFNTKQIGAPLVRIRDLATQAPDVWTDEEHPKGYRLSAGDIVIGMDGEFRAHLWAGPTAWLNQRVCVFRPRDGYCRVFVRNAVAAPLAFVEATETATTVIHLGKSDIDGFRFVVAPRATHHAFSKISTPWYERFVAAKRESATLAALRDTLLPKLISGELRVPASLGSMQEVAS
jgi:type I restriction enzyme, S subunit